MKRVMMGSLLVALVSAILMHQIGKLGSVKQQALDYLKVKDIRYEMSSEFLPIHEFSIFHKYEIINRMECLINRNAEACMAYCDDEHKITKSPLSKKWKCYKHKGVPAALYGEQKCDSQFNKTRQYDENFYCKSNAGVKLTLKDACGVSEFAARKLECYKGKVIVGIGSVPYDKEYC